MKNIHKDDVDDKKLIRKQEKKLKKWENQKMGKVFKNLKKKFQNKNNAKNIERLEYGKTILR